MVLARFKRDERRVKFVRDPMGGHFVITDTPTEQQVEHFGPGYVDFQYELYQTHGYRRLVLCPSCRGTGIEWYQHNGEADRDVCSVCQGEGGT